MGMHLVSRRQVRNFYLSLRGVPPISYDNSSDTDEDEEPIASLPVEEILADVLDGWDPNPPPFSRCWRMPYPAISRKDRLAAAVHLCLEVAQSRRIVFVCFICHSYTVGYTCYQHHIKTCLNMELIEVAQYEALRERRFFAPPSWQWADCAHCIRQEVMAARHNRIRPISAVLHWARLFVQLVLRKVMLAPLFCASPALNDTLGASIAQFL
jgi:hypothetical protein